MGIYITTLPMKFPPGKFIACKYGLIVTEKIWKFPPMRMQNFSILMENYPECTFEEFIF